MSFDQVNKFIPNLGDDLHKDCVPNIIGSHPYWLGYECLKPIPTQTTLVKTNIGLVHRWMHDINNQHQQWYPETYPWYQNCNTHQILIFGKHLKVRGLLYTRDKFWVNTILEHIDTTTISPKYEALACYVESIWYRMHEYHQKPIPYWYHRKLKSSLKTPEWY